MRPLFTSLALLVQLMVIGQGGGALVVPYDSAIALYERGDHQRALEGLLAVAVDHESATLEFNIGNCYYKLGDVPRALLHYERAALLAPGDDDVRANLDLTRTLVVDRVNEPPGFTLGSAWERFRSGGGPDQWSIVSLWACALLFSALALYFLLRLPWIRRASLVIAAAALISLIVALILAGQRHVELTAHDHAIIMSPKVEVTSEPRSGGTLLFVLHEGTKVKVLEQRGDRCSVRIVSGAVGWMPVKDLERI
jgi:tetratricopeptide (TPR) repeat protein